jgi:hypothetical protein
MGFYVGRIDGFDRSDIAKKDTVRSSRFTITPTFCKCCLSLPSVFRAPQDSAITAVTVQLRQSRAVSACWSACVSLARLW